MSTMFVTFEVSNCGMAVSFEQLENMYLMLVTFEVSNLCMEVSDEQLLNIWLMSVTFSESLGCQQPSNDFAVLCAHFPPASKKAFMEGSVFSIVNVGQTFLSPR